MHRLALALCLSLLAAPLAAQAQVHVTGIVHGSDPGLQATIDAAADGDVILIRAFGGQPFDLSGKSLVLQADAPFSPVVSSAFLSPNAMQSGDGLHSEIHDLPAGKTVVLRGLLLRGLELRDVQGTVMIEDCKLSGTSPAFRATNVAHLVIEGGEIQGPTDVDDLYFPQTGGPGAVLIDSTAWLHGVAITGGHGADFHCGSFGFCWNSSGKDALVVSGSSSVQLEGGSCTGGHGGKGGTDLLGQCFAGGSGGHGIDMFAGWPIVIAHGTQTAGGAGATGPAPGSCFFGSAGDGVNGQAVNVIDGEFDAGAGHLDVLSGNSPVREGQALAVSVSGAAGAPFALLISPQPALFHVSAIEGALLAQPPFTTLLLGPLPAAGQLTLSGLVPELGPVVEGLPLVLQLVSHAAPSTWVAGPASAVLLLDGSL
jgi:hypothetical protein